MGGRVGEGQGGWERRSEAFVNIKKNGGGGEVRSRGWGGGGGRVGEGQGGCERRGEAFVKIKNKKKNWGGGGGGGVRFGGGGDGVRVDGNGEVKLL